jgi:signal transduction histidine kinase
MAIRNLPLDKAVDERADWLIRLRWYAGGVVILLGLAAALAVPAFPAPALAGLGAAILAYNGFVWLALPRLGPRRGLHLQIVLDWVALAVLCHLTMGVDSPFLPFFLFHVILAAMLTNRRSCLRHGLLAIGIIAVMAVLEYTGRLRPVPIPGIPASPRSESLLFLLMFLGSFSVLILLTVYLSTTVIQHLRRGEEKLVQLQESLGRTYEDLREADQAKTRFIRIVSHEIRSPLAATRSMIRVVLDGYAGEVAAKTRELLQRCDERMAGLLALINELLDLIRGGQPIAEEEKQDIPLQSAVQKVVRDLSVLAARKELRLDVRLEGREVVFRGDSQDLEGIVHNLVSNAIAYTPDYGAVTVLGQPEKDGAYRLAVRDTGIGIPADELPRIFEEFYRASNARKSKKEGTGLGLSIVKVTVEKYGGRISVESQPGRGTTFTVWLPVIALPS